MRLIDADKIDFKEIFAGVSDFAQGTREAAQMLIDAQPTAYDVDKVVKNLKEFCEEIGDEVTDIFETVIDIVKEGGTDE